jgi:hypothetical protein
MNQYFAGFSKLDKSVKQLLFDWYQLIRAPVFSLPQKALAHKFIDRPSQCQGLTPAHTKEYATGATYRCCRLLITKFNQNGE